MLFKAIFIIIFHVSCYSGIKSNRIMEVRENQSILKLWKAIRFIGLVYSLMLLVFALKVLFLDYLNYDRDQYPVFYTIESLQTIPFVLIPLTFMVFLIISIVVAFRTKLKTIDSKRLVLISTILLLLTTVVFILLMVTPNINDFNDFSSKSEMHLVSLWIANFLVSSIALFLYVLVYNIYSICTKFKLEGSKRYFYFSLACLIIILSIAGILYLKLS